MKKIASKMRTSRKKLRAIDEFELEIKIFRRYRAYALYHKKRRIRKKYRKKLQKMLCAPFLQEGI